MAQRIIVQDGIVSYSTSDPTVDVNVNMSGLLNVTKEISVGNDPLAPGSITTYGAQDLNISAGNNIKIAPTGSILLNNVAWPSSTSVSPGAFIGSSAVNTLAYYPFVIAFNGSDTLSNAQLVSAYPTAVVGQSVIGPSTVYQCVASGLWRRLSSAAGSVSSVDLSGGTTGLFTTGGPITSTGTITINGTLGISNGGTGQTSSTQAFNALAPTQTGNSGKVLYTDGTNASWVSVDGGSIYQPVLVATSSNISLSGSSPVIDGVTVPDNSRVLVRSQTVSTDNGIYITSAGAWARSSDWAAGLTRYAGTQIFCTSGNIYSQSIFTLSSSTRTVIVGSGVYSFLTANALASSLSGTTLASNVVNSSLVTVGTLTNLTVSGKINSNGNIARSVSTGIVSTGTNIGTSFGLTKDVNVISTVSTGTGVSLPTGIIGAEIIIINTGTNPVNVYPDSGSSAINALATGAAFSLAAGAKNIFICVSSTQWYTLN
jgi:hypothetical protein